MKNYFFPGLLSILLFIGNGLTVQGDPVAFTAMSFNIRYDNPADGKNAWPVRKEALAEMILVKQPDIIGLQEVVHGQLSYLLERLPEYGSYGVGRDDGFTAGEYSPILYRKDRFDLAHGETIWLSESTDTASVGWDASMTRICTFITLHDRESHDTIRVFNAHFDHRGPEAREMSANLILKKIHVFVPEGQPVLVMGDLNAEPNEPPLVRLRKELQDPWPASGGKGPEGTFNGWTEADGNGRRIDYILVRDLQVLSAEHLPDRRPDGYFLSDHFPVFARLK